ncbi:MAG: cardiolipin synthase B, partial [Caldimonas sp.]
MPAAKRRRMILIVAGTVIATVAGVLLFLNLGSGEKRIERRLERLYPLDDPRFVQELGVLLGPPLLEGNRCRVLQNGDEIFPPMLAAIGAAKKTFNFETDIYWSGNIVKA